MSEVTTGKDLGLNTVKGRLLITKEIAEFLRTSERWVQKHMNDGTFPFPWYPIGERNHVADSWDFDQWLSSIKVQAGTAAMPKRSVKKILQKEASA
jgi:predicted DNA-binding transcriptional regulator AlpA